ncbi:MAG TPA: hypothetical protein VF546_01965 [Pyrinomonadaceae bacterium]|jgi:hypothetical protein
MTRSPFDDEAPPDPPAPQARAYAAAELIACPACQRTNAPTRLRCLYCGAALPAPAAGREDLRRPALRALEAWEQGFNVVLHARAEDAPELPPETVAEAARLLRLEPDLFARVLAARTPLPVACAASAEEAAFVERRLGALGLACAVVADETLGVAAQPPQRVRRFEFDDAGLTAWSGAEGAPQTVAWGELVLLVVGRISRRQIEIEERGGRRARGEIVATREFYEDESVLDLYTDEPARNWRVRAESFDYNCLGAGKSLLAAENFARLVAALRARAAAVVCDEDYQGLRHLLAAAWPAAEETASGLRRGRPGRLNREAITTVSNETQFTRYGRLRQHLLLRART